MNHGIDARQFMAEFADRTGLLPGSPNPPRRYLWTDAFAVCNYLALARRDKNRDYLDLAVRLVDQVHTILGRHRDDDPRNGWISGLGEVEGKRHPTAGGLRIGKELPERSQGDPLNERLEWERDGQYYHYLTKWMHALCSIAIATNDQSYLRYAAELAEVSHAAFIYTVPDGSKRMYWKMSIDLSRPLVESMGHHDPLDGLICSMLIRELKDRYPTLECYDPADDIALFAGMCRGENWVTGDPLGLGTLLADALILTQLLSLSSQTPLTALVEDMLQAANIGLSIFSREGTLPQPAAYRLAFRELGLAIGLQSIPRLLTVINRQPELFRNASIIVDSMENLQNYHQTLQEQILQFWLTEENREVSSWTEHADINTVMLATCLLPEGYLDPLRVVNTEEGI